MNEFCIDCKNLSYQYTITGDMEAVCILRNETIEHEGTFGCSEFDDAELPF